MIFKGKQLRKTARDRHMSQEGRTEWLRQRDQQVAGGPTLGEQLKAAEAELAGAEEDWSITADHLRIARYDVTHTEGGTQRSMNPGGELELAEAAPADAGRFSSSLNFTVTAG